MGFLDSVKNKKYINAIHPDLKNLVYIEKHVPKDFDPNRHEPSTIYLDLSVTKPDASTEVPRPDYWPAYAQFTREQRYNYLRFLADPYALDHDTGYFFCLLYGLERHLHSDNFDGAARVILKLLGVCFSDSFQKHATQSLFFAAAKRDNIPIIRELITTEIAYRLDINAFIFAKIFSEMPFTAEDLLHYRKDFGLKSKYLPEREEVFLEKLREAMNATLGTDTPMLDSLFNAAKEEGLPCLEYTLFANLSLPHKTIGIYEFTEIPSFRASCEGVLDVAKINCSPKKVVDEKLAKKQNGESQTYLHGDIEFNENEEIFYQELLRQLSGVCEEKDLQVELFENREKRLSFYAFGSDIGDVKLRGRTYRIQIVYPENRDWGKVYNCLDNTKMEWISCASVEDAIQQIPFWVDRTKAIKQYRYV